MPDPILATPATPAADPVAPAAVPAAATPAATPATPATPAPAAAADPAKPATPAAPIAYDLKPSKPDSIPAAAIAQVADIAKELGLTQESAQKLLARHEATFTAHQAALAEQQAKQSDAWYDELAADKEFGGDKLTKTTDDAKRGFATLSEAERQSIIDAGYANNPILVKLLARHGATLGEGSMGGRSARIPANDLRSIYTSMPNA